jgi:hypothetical protein
MFNLIDIMGLGIIIIGTIFSVHFVYQRAYRLGREAGISEGRLQVLSEDLIRSSQKASIDHNLENALDLFLKNKTENLKSKIKDNNKTVH